MKHNVLWHQSIMPLTIEHELLFTGCLNSGRNLMHAGCKAKEIMVLNIERAALD